MFFNFGLRPHEWPKHVGSYEYDKLTFTYPSALVGLLNKYYRYIYIYLINARNM